MIRICLFLFTCLFSFKSSAQYKWKLEKEQYGIKVFSSAIPHSSYKAIKVECTLAGNYSKLYAILSNVADMSNWVYKAHAPRLLKQITPLDLIYYTETEMPWPLSNRDAVIHLRFNTDSLPKFLVITGRSEPGVLAPVPDKVRVNNYRADWKVTMPTATTLKILYTVELDPGGSIPGWIANMFVSKGPFETFGNLAKKLKE